jgi:maleamate amidohydrolase
MTERVWDKFLTERDKQVFAASGFGALAGFGKRPALLVIDVNMAFCGDKSEPILQSIEKSRHCCGEDAYVALPYIQALRDAAHAKGVPVIYTTDFRRDDNWDSGAWNWKNGRDNEEVAGAAPLPNFDGNAIHPMIAPGPRDLMCYKQKPSGFFGTNLLSYLTLLGCDSVIVVGTSTSGCVRATVIDAASYNYRVIVAEEGCFDRSEASHAINLCDMNAKYADVIPTAEVLAYFEGLAEGLFDLPKGSAVKRLDISPKLAAE